MLNPFPIQFLALLAYFLLRVFVGGILLYLGFRHWRHRRTLREVVDRAWVKTGSFGVYLWVLFELAAGAFILAGAYTQYAALAIILYSLKLIILGARFRHPLVPPRLFYVLLLGASLSLFITGAGAFAFDLPL